MPARCMISPEGFRAVRILRKLWLPIAIERERFQRLDARFDAGEWSGPWHDLQGERELADLIARVAKALHLEPALIEAWWIEADELTLDYIRNSHRKAGTA